MALVRLKDCEKELKKGDTVYLSTKLGGQTLKIISLGPKYFKLEKNRLIREDEKFDNKSGQRVSEYCVNEYCYSSLENYLQSNKDLLIKRQVEQALGLVYGTKKDITAEQFKKIHEIIFPEGTAK